MKMIPSTILKMVIVKMLKNIVKIFIYINIYFTIEWIKIDLKRKKNRNNCFEKLDTQRKRNDSSDS